MRQKWINSCETSTFNTNTSRSNSNGRLTWVVSQSDTALGIDLTQ